MHNKKHLLKFADVLWGKFFLFYIQLFCSLNGNMFFEPGDTISFSFFQTIGFVTGSGSQLIITIPCGKFLQKVSGFEMSNITMTVRQNGTYIIGSGIGPEGIDDFQISSKKVQADQGTLMILLSDDGPIENAINNDIAAVYIQSGSLTFS